MQRDSGERVIYDPVARWNSRQLGERFSAQVVPLIDERHPGVLPGALRSVASVV